MSKVHGTGGIGGNELEVDLDAISGMAGAIGRVFAPDHAKDALQGGIGEPDVDEAGTSDLDRFDFGCGLDVRGDDLGDLARIHVSLLGASHGDRRCPVTMREVARTLDAYLGNVFEGKLPRPNC